MFGKKEKKQNINMKKMYKQPKVEEMVLPLSPFMLDPVSKGTEVNEDEPAHAPKRKTPPF